MKYSRMIIILSTILLSCACRDNCPKNVKKQTILDIVSVLDSLHQEISFKRFPVYSKKILNVNEFDFPPIFRDTSQIVGSKISFFKRNEKNSFYDKKNVYFPDTSGYELTSYCQIPNIGFENDSLTEYIAVNYTKNYKDINGVLYDEIWEVHSKYICEEFMIHFNCLVSN